jgi:hypothetical protein
MPFRARLLAAFVLIAVAFVVSAAPAGAQSTSLISARVAPILGVVVARDGAIGTGSTVDTTVRRQRVGRTLYVTVIPRI